MKYNCVLITYTGMLLIMDSPIRHIVVTLELHHTNLHYHSPKNDPSSCQWTGSRVICRVICKDIESVSRGFLWNFNFSILRRLWAGRGFLLGNHRDPGVIVVLLIGIECIPLSSIVVAVRGTGRKTHGKVIRSLWQHVTANDKQV